MKEIFKLVLQMCVCGREEPLSLKVKLDELYKRTEVLSGCMRYLYHTYI